MIPLTHWGRQEKIGLLKMHLVLGILDQRFQNDIYVNESPGQNTGVGRPSLLQGISPTQESNPGLPHCRWILYCLSHHGSPTWNLCENSQVIRSTIQNRSQGYRCRIWYTWNAKVLIIWDGHIHTVLFKCITNKDLTAHGTMFNVMWQSGWEGSLGKQGYVYGRVPSFFTFILQCHQTIMTLLTGYVSVCLRRIQLCDPKDCSPSDSSVHGILQVRTLGWVAIPFSRGCSWLPVQFSSVAQLCPTLCDPMNHSTPGLSVHQKLLEFTQTHAHRVSDAIQTSHPLSSPSPPTLNPSQHQGLFHWVNSSHEVVKVLEFQLQHQSFQWIPRTYLLQDGLAGSPCSPRDSQESSPTL